MHKGGHYKRNKEKIYIEEQAEKKLKELKDREQEERNTLRYKKLIAATAKKILQKNSKILSLNDYRDISKEVYNKTDNISTVRVKRQMTKEIAKEEIDKTLVQILIENDIKKGKISELIKKAEENAKTTKDYLDIMREIKAIYSPTESHTVTERIDFKEIDKNAEKRTTLKRTSQM